MWFFIGSLVGFCTAQSHFDSRSQVCEQLHQIWQNESQTDVERDCKDLFVAHAESISGGYCLASMTGAGYYRSTAINPISALLLGLEGNMDRSPIITGSNSGGTMFVVRYFALRDLPNANKWTFPCYLLRHEFRRVCFFHGNFGAISEECYSESQNTISIATQLVYGSLMSNNGGPLGIVSSYCSVYFAFLSNLPIDQKSRSLDSFWESHTRWNRELQASSNWVAAFTLISPVEASSGQQSYNYGFDAYLSRGMSTHKSDWYSNMSVYSVASISANTPSGMTWMPFSFAGKEWEDGGGSAAVLKVVGTVISFIMLKRLVSAHAILATTAAPSCKGSCPMLDGGYTDNGPITPVLASASEREETLRPRHVSLLSPMSTMSGIKYLMGIGPLNIWGSNGLNMCPFTQPSVCKMITQMRELMIPQLSYEVGEEYRSIGSQYQVHRPNQQIISPYCMDPLIFDHFHAMCQGDNICHMVASTVSSPLTGIKFGISQHLFQLSMVWLAPSNIARRFVGDYVPEEMRAMKYYADMDLWFPDFVAIAPQKGGVGFTKVAGHSILDYLTYLVLRLTKTEIKIRLVAFEISQGKPPACGYNMFESTRALTTSG